MQLYGKLSNYVSTNCSNSNCRTPMPGALTEQVTVRKTNEINVVIEEKHAQPRASIEEFDINKNRDLEGEMEVREEN